MEVEKKKEMKDILMAHCPICGKEIVGTAESQIRYNLELHIKQKHREDK